MCMLLITHSIQWEIAISAPPGSKSWIREVPALKLTRLPKMPDLVENARRITQKKKKKKWRNLLFSGACYTWSSISNYPGRSSPSFTWQNGRLLPGCELSQPWAHLNSRLTSLLSYLSLLRSCACPSPHTDWSVCCAVLTFLHEGWHMWIQRYSLSRRQLRNHA